MGFADSIYAPLTPTSGNFVIVSLVDCFHDDLPVEPVYELVSTLRAINKARPHLPLMTACSALKLSLGYLHLLSHFPMLSSQAGKTWRTSRDMVQDWSTLRFHRYAQAWHYAVLWARGMPMVGLYRASGSVRAHRIGKVRGCP